MFQKPLHFDRTGIRVVAMCPGYTISNIVVDENTLLVAEWMPLTKRNIYQPYALQHNLINYKLWILTLRKSYMNIYP
jgi:NAD(P)-dependent dehydrogenase (short-subunit alcohol dehydrogenase family)